VDRRSFIGAGALAAIASAAAQADTRDRKPVPSLAPASATPGRVRWALALGGGTARGFAHIGVLKVLQQEGLRPDLVVGCSAGALIGALYASGMSALQMEDLALKVRDSEIADIVTGNRRGMVAGEALQSFVNRHVRNLPIERFPVPFAAVATNLTLGETAVFSAGDAGLAVRASSSIPAIFIPVRINDQEYVDGGLINPVPVHVARDMGVDRVVAVSLNDNPHPGNPSGMFELLMQSFEIMASSLTRHELSDADAVVKPDLGRIAFTDFTSRNLMVTLGEQAARRALPQIRGKLLSKA
jgi:NTE family protein